MNMSKEAIRVREIDTIRSYMSTISSLLFTLAENKNLDSYEEELFGIIGQLKMYVDMMYKYGKMHQDSNNNADKNGE